ncbi:MAG: DUF4261 domain-containing protein [Cellulosilyticum sp.]|nr:DUF4261 domain-containing protein [Cellulosilyticum sp.]
MNHTTDANQENKNTFALYFLFPRVTVFNKEMLIQSIKSVTHKKVEINPIVGLNGKDKALFAHAVVEGEVFELIGMETPLPQNIIDYTIGCAYGPAEEIEAMRNHGAHILVFYRGESTDRMKIFNAYKKLAYGFLDQGLLGIANPYSWNVIGAGIIRGMIEDEETKAFAETPAMMIWRSFIKIPHKDGVWFVTKGNNLFGITEYAYFGKMEEAQEVYDIFENIFSYVYETNTSISVGDTMQIEEDTYICFKEVEELQDQLNGETIGTLVIEKTSSEQVN